MILTKYQSKYITKSQIMYIYYIYMCNKHFENLKSLKIYKSALFR